MAVRKSALSHLAAVLWPRFLVPSAQLEKRRALESTGETEPALASRQPALRESASSQRDQRVAMRADSSPGPQPLSAAKARYAAVPEQNSNATLQPRARSQPEQPVLA